MKHLHLLGLEPINVEVLEDHGDTVDVLVMHDPNDPQVFPSGSRATVYSALVSD